MSSLLIGKKAPYFKSKAVHKATIIEDFSLDLFEGKYVVLFFYPMDFTFVCPTELHAFQEKLHLFKEKDCEIIGCSIDTPYTHLAWLRTPKSEGGIEGIQFPLISDVKKDLAREYHVLNYDEGIAFRGLFLIDKDGIVQHQLVNANPIGRSVDEAERVLDALIFYEANGEVCPANWRQGEKTMEPSQKGLTTFYGA